VTRTLSSIWKSLETELYDSVPDVTPPFSFPPTRKKNGCHTSPRPCVPFLYHSSPAMEVRTWMYCTALVCTVVRGQSPRVCADVPFLLGTSRYLALCIFNAVAASYAGARLCMCPRSGPAGAVALIYVRRWVCAWG